MILGPVQINHLIEYHGLVTPYENDPVRRDSVDLRIARILRHKGGAHLSIEKTSVSVGNSEEMKPINGIWALDPQIHYVLESLEEINLPVHIAAITIPRSTLMRAGIQADSGYIDPGYSGKIFMMVETPGPAKTEICFGFSAMQLIFLHAEPVPAYDGSYQGGSLAPNLA